MINILKYMIDAILSFFIGEAKEKRNEEAKIDEARANATRDAIKRNLNNDMPSIMRPDEFTRKDD